MANGSNYAQTPEVSELKAMILGLVQQGAEHKALITGLPLKSSVYLPCLIRSSIVVVAPLALPVSQLPSLTAKIRPQSDPLTVHPPSPARPSSHGTDSVYM